MKTLWRRCGEVWKVDFLSRFLGGLHRDIRTTVYFWIVINALAALVMTGQIFTVLYGGKTAVRDSILSFVPDGATMTLRDGVLTLNGMPDPFLHVFQEANMITESDEPTLLVIDTQGGTYDVTTLESYKQGAAILRDRVYVKGDGQINEVLYKDIADFTVSKEDGIAWIDRYFGVGVALLSVVTGLVLFVTLVIARAVAALWWGLILWLVARIFQVVMPYKTAYLAVLNLYFVPIVVTTVLSLLGLQISYVGFVVFLAVFIANMVWMRRNPRVSDDSAVGASSAVGEHTDASHVASVDKR